MGKSKKTQTSTDIDGPAMVAAMKAVNPVATKAWLEIMSESARFVTDRLQQDFDTQAAMLACKSPTELLEVQSKFFSRAMEEYSNEAARLYKLMFEAAEESIDVAQSGHSRGHDDVPL